ncbi:MAG TPA: ATP-binding protein [Chakrabartia sp.]|jgi:two-component system sensor histidine kinase ChvG|nr:ATP-binding protein [Chakrabartia sp.]
MVPDTASVPPEPRNLVLRWSGRIPLAARILLVNILPLALLAASFFYLDGFRSRLIGERITQTQNEARLLAAAIVPSSKDVREGLISRPGDPDRVRLRLVRASGAMVFDSWQRGARVSMIDPVREQSWQRRAARWLDEAIDGVVGAEIPPGFPGYGQTAQLKPDAPLLSLMDDRTHMISVKQPLAGDETLFLVLDRNARDVRRLVRSERTTLGYAVGLTALVSVLLSLFLARTIVRPLQVLSFAANEVRYGQAREVTVPRLPSRRDEIGSLARAVSDMTHALRTRIDAIESFAADVAHELKNPLASLRSAVESLERVTDPAHRALLLGIVDDDVRRMDRLITDISDLSRIDARIGRIRFETVDLGGLIGGLLDHRAERLADPVPVAFARPADGSVRIHGDAAQLSRVFDNLLDNALSFSPPDGVVRIGATASRGRALVAVDDDGPGIPEALREAVFDRFHSSRPDEAFGQHSGLGLAIARAIVEAHGGTIRVEDGPDGRGTRMVVELPLVESAGDD